MEIPNNLQTRIVLSIILPPFAIWHLRRKIGTEFFITLLLTAFFWIPGSIYVLGVTIWEHQYHHYEICDGDCDSDNGDGIFSSLLTSNDRYVPPYFKSVENAGNSDEIELLEPKPERITRFDDFSAFTLNVPPPPPPPPQRSSNNSFITTDGSFIRRK